MGNFAMRVSDAIQQQKRTGQQLVGQQLDEQPNDVALLFNP